MNKKQNKKPKFYPFGLHRMNERLFAAHYTENNITFDNDEIIFSNILFRGTNKNDTTNGRISFQITIHANLKYTSKDAKKTKTKTNVNGAS